MGYDLFGALLFAALTPLVIVGFIVFWLLTHRERAHIETCWQVLAAARDRVFVPARGEWPNRTSPAVRWTTSGVAFALTVVGVEANARTRLSGSPKGRLLGRFVARAGRRQPGETAIGSAFFARSFAVTERPTGLAERVLDDDAQKALLRFRQRDDIVLRYRRGCVVLEWPGRESSDARIAEAEHVVGVVVRRIDELFAHAVSRAA